MPPGMVMGLMLLEMGHVFLRIMWLQPDLGTGRLLYYEFRLNGGMWMSTMSPSTEYNITGLTPDTLYSIEVRAVTDVGMGSASAVLMARTAATTVPTVPQFARADAPGGPFIDLTWNLPTDDGGAVIARYDVLVTGPDGVAFPVESTGSPATNYQRARVAAVPAVRVPDTGGQQHRPRPVHRHNLCNSGRRGGWGCH